MYLVLLLPPLAALLLFFPTLGHRFVWDDFPFLVHNEALRSLDNLPSFFYDEATAAARAESPGIYRPLRNVVWALGYSLFELNAVGYHLQNTLLHAINAFLVALLALAVGLRRDAASVAGCAFAVHPLVTEAVAWVKAVDDLLVAVFLIAGAAIAGRIGRRMASGAEPRLRSLLALAVLQVAALASKEGGVVFPALALATLWLGFELGSSQPSGVPRQRSPIGVLLKLARERIVLAFIVLAAALDVFYLVVRTRVLGEVAQLEQPLATGAALFFTQLRATARGLSLVVWPAALRADYDGYRISTSIDIGSGAALLVLLLLLGSAGFALSRRGWWTCWTWAVVWWFVVLLPVSNLVPTMQFLAERFLYVAVVAPAIGLGCIFDLSVSLGRIRYRVLVLGTTLLLAALALRSSHRLSDWRTPVDLFASVVEDNPRGLRALGNLCRSLFVEGRYGESLARLRELESLSPDDHVVSDLETDVVALAEVEDILPDLLEQIDREPDNLVLRLRLVELGLHARHFGTVRTLVEGLPANLEWRRLVALAVIAAHRGDPARADSLLEQAARPARGEVPTLEELALWRAWVDRAVAETSRMDFVPPEKPPAGLFWMP